jgi:hypothetical protein
LKFVEAFPSPRGEIRTGFAPQICEQANQMNTGATAIGLTPAAENLLSAGRREEARRTFRRALELQPGDGRAACGLARLLLSERDLRGAVEVVRATMVRAPFDLRVAALQREIGLALFSESLWEDAEPWLERAVALEPWDPSLVSACQRVRHPAYVPPEVCDLASGKMLSDLLADNAVLHQVYSLIAAQTDWVGNLRKAVEQLRSLQVRTAHQEVRDSCQWLLAALASLKTVPAQQSPALLTFELQDQEAISHLAASRRERYIRLFRQQLLRHRLLSMASGNEAQIPRVVHLIKTDARTEDLPLLQYLCYRSILAHCKGYRIILHTPEIPYGARWKKLLPHLEPNIAVPPQLLGNFRIVGAAHQSDVWRLQQLIEHGGFYFDWDLLLLQSPQELRSHVCVMALERVEQGYREVLGVSAIGAEPGSQFLTTWLEAMSSAFNPSRYVAHSTLLAHALALRLLSLVRVLEYPAFYYPGWGVQAMRWLFDPAECLPEDELHEHLAASTGLHLFSSHANFLHWAGRVTEKDIEVPRCNLATLMRPYL